MKEHLPYPDNLLAAIGITTPTRLTSQAVDDVLEQVLQTRSPGYLPLIHSLYRDGVSIASLAKSLGTSKQNLHQKRDIIIKYLSKHSNMFTNSKPEIKQAIKDQACPSNQPVTTKLQRATTTKEPMYPSNLLTELGFVFPPKADVTFAARRLSKVLKAQSPVYYGVVLDIYRDNCSLEEVAARKGIPETQARLLLFSVQQFLKQPDVSAKIQEALLDINAKVREGALVWRQALDTGATHINAADVVKVKKYLSMLGVIFPAGKSGTAIASLINPSLAKKHSTLAGLNAYELVDLANLGFDKNTCYALMRHKVYTLWDILIMSGCEFQNLRGIGQFTVNKIFTCLAKMNFNVDHLHNPKNLVSPYSA